MLALVLMDRGKWLLGVFTPLGILLSIESNVTWRGYVMAWLGVHALVSVRFADEGYRAKQITLAIVSIGGMGWLWGAGGWLYARPVITGAVIAAGAAAVALSCHGVWKFCKAHGTWPLQRRARAVPAGERLHIPGDRPSSRPRPGPGLVAPPRQAQESFPDRVGGLRPEPSRRFEPLGPVPAGSVTGEAGTQKTGSGDAGNDEVYTAFAVRDFSAADVAGNEPVFWGKRVYRIRKLTQEGEADRWYVVVEFARIAIAAPGEVRRAAEAARDAFSAGEKSFVDASRGLFVSEITNDVFDGAFGGKGGDPVRWVTRDPMELGAIDTAINDASHWLHSAVAMPFRDAAGELGACPPGMVPLVGDIAAKMTLAPLDRSISKLTRNIEFIGVGVGLAFGLAPLAIACSKLLVHRELGRALDAGVRELGRSLFGDPASREAEANVIQAQARAAELPGLSRERAAELTRPGVGREAREAAIPTSQRVDAALRRRPGRTAESRGRSRHAEVERTAAEESSSRAVRERDAVSELEIGWGR